MNRLKLVFVIVAALCVAYSGTAMAAGIKAQPFEFDPDGSGIVTAAWVAHEGLPDAGRSNHALFLQKDGPTATVASAGASISGVEGMEVTELGFDYRTDGTCTSGAPRFNLRATDGFHFIGGCGNGTVTGSPAPGWNTVRFDPQNPAQAFPVVAPGATIISLSVLLDEGTDGGAGFVYLDNIDVNGTLIGKPGNH